MENRPDESLPPPPLFWPPPPPPPCCYGHHYPPPLNHCLDFFRLGFQSVKKHHPISENQQAHFPFQIVPNCHPCFPSIPGSCALPAFSMTNLYGLNPHGATDNVQEIAHDPEWPEGDEHGFEIFNREDEVGDEDELEPEFVLTDEWMEFFAKSEAKRKKEKKHRRKLAKAARKAARLSEVCDEQVQPNVACDDLGDREKETSINIADDAEV